MIKFILTMLILTICFYAYLSACTCVGGKPEVKEGLNESDAVFSGFLYLKKRISVNDSNLFEGEKLVLTEYGVVIEKIFKGSNLSDTVSIITGLGNGDCGNILIVGNKYIVYAKIKHKWFPKGDSVTPYLYTNICTRTGMWNVNEEQAIMQIIDYNK